MDYSKVQPLGSKVLLKKRHDLCEPEKVGSIFIPQTTNATMRETKIGEIVALGHGTASKDGTVAPIDLQASGFCYYARYGVNRFEDPHGSDDELIMLNESACLADVTLINGKVTLAGITPRHDRVIVKELDMKGMTTSGIIYKKQIDKDKQVAEFRVIKCGPGKFDPKTGTRSEMTCQSGDLAITADINGAKFSIWEGESWNEYRLISESDLYCCCRE